jgi:hypothetical protein
VAAAKRLKLWMQNLVSYRLISGEGEGPFPGKVMYVKCGLQSPSSGPFACKSRDPLREAKFDGQIRGESVLDMRMEHTIITIRSMRRLRHA